MSQAKVVHTPMCPNNVPVLHDGTYRSIVGGLQYLSLTRPNVAFAVNKLSQLMHHPTTEHWSSIKRLLRYDIFEVRTVHHGLYFCRNSPLSLHAFSNVDWAGNVDDHTSTSAHIVFLCSNAFSWSSKKQRSVARLSTEAEYSADATAAAEVRWIKFLLHELGVLLSHMPAIYCDNIGTTYLCANPVFHSRMKHIAIDFHFVRDKVQSDELWIFHISSTNQLAMP